MSDWADYQERAASFFRSLGLEAEVNARVVGVRSVHKVDVWVTFTRFGLKHRWYVECKFWKRRVPKERIEIVKTISAEVGRSSFRAF